MKDLVEASKRQDAEAFAKLYEIVYKDMYAYAYYMLSNEQDAEDIVSETVMSAYEGIKKLKDSSLFRNWIFKILSNKCKKKRKQYAKRSEHYLEDIKKEITTEDVNHADREVIRKAFSLLSDEERMIVGSYIFGGFKGEEIAEKLGMKHSTVRSKYRRTLQKLQRELEAGGVV